MPGAFGTHRKPMTPEELAAKEQAISSANEFLWAMTGIPMATEGVRDIQGAFADDGFHPVDAGIGAAKVGVGALPFLGKLAAPLFSTLPRAAGTISVSSLIPGFVTDAEAARRDAEKKKRKAQKSKNTQPTDGSSIETGSLPSSPGSTTPEGAFASGASGAPSTADQSEPDIYELAAKRDPLLRQILDKRKMLLSTHNRDRARLENQYAVEAGRGHAGPLAAGIQKDIAKLQSDLALQLEPIDAQLNSAVEKYLPFDQAFPNVAPHMTGLNVALPFLAALATRGAGRALLNAPTKRLNRAVAQGEKAYDAGRVGMADRKASEVGEYLKSYKGDGPFSVGGNKWTDVVLPSVAGAAAGAEVSLYPDQYNRRNALPGTKEQTLAEDKLKPENFAKSAFPGMALGALGGFTAGHMPGRVVYPNVAGGRALVNRINDPSPQSPAARSMVRDREGEALARGGGAELPQIASEIVPPQRPESRQLMPPLSDEAIPAPKPQTQPHELPSPDTLSGPQQSGTPGTPGTDDPSKRKAKKRWFDTAISKFEQNQIVEDALSEVNKIIPNKGFSRHERNKRLRIIRKMVKDNPGASSNDIADMIRKYIDEAKSGGKVYSSALGALLLGTDKLGQPDGSRSDVPKNGGR